MIKDTEFRLKGFVVWLICAVFFLYEFFIRTVIGTYQYPIMMDLHLNVFEFSLLSTTLFFIVYGLMQVPVGIITNSIGLKRSLLIATLICTIASFGFALSHTYSCALIFRMLMGFGASFAFICLLVSVNEWMPHRYSAIFIGLSQCIGTIGPMLGAGPLYAMSEATHVSWRFIFLMLSGVGVILAILVLFFVSNNNAKAGKYIILSRPKNIKRSIQRLFSGAQPWYIAIVSVGLYFTIEYLSENEARSFLYLKGVSLSKASYMITISWLGYAIGCPLLGFLSDLLFRRKIIMIIASVLGVLSIVSIIYAFNELYLSFAFFFLGISASGQSIGFAAVTEQFKRQFIAVGFGLNNAMITLFSAFSAPFLGALLDYVKKGGKITLPDYQLVFILLILISLISFIFSSLFIRETYCKSSVDFTYLDSRRHS